MDDELVLDDNEKDAPSSKPVPSATDAPTTDLTWQDVEERFEWIREHKGPICLRWAADESVGLTLSGLSPDLKNMMIQRSKDGSSLKVFSDPHQAVKSLYEEHKMEVPAEIDGYKMLMAQVKADPSKDEKRWVPLRSVLPQGVRVNAPEPPASLKQHAGSLQNLTWPTEAPAANGATEKANGKKKGGAGGEGGGEKRKRAPAKKKEEGGDGAEQQQAKKKTKKTPSNTPEDAAAATAEQEAASDPVSEGTGSVEGDKLALMQFVLLAEAPMVKQLTKYCQMLLSQQSVLESSDTEEPAPAASKPEKEKAKKPRKSPSEPKKSKSKKKKEPTPDATPASQEDTIDLGE